MRKPTKINFESSTSCNSMCTFCPRYIMTRNKGEMSDELFYKIIKEGKEMGVTNYSPFLNGEPFVFPRIWDWLDYMEKEGVGVGLYTNGEFIDVDRIIKYKNIRYINCSINAATKETYDKVMRRPNYERVVKNVNELYKKAPFMVRSSMVVTEDNIHEVEQFKKMYRRAHVVGFYDWTGDKHDKYSRKGEKEPCYVLLHQMFILWDGRVVACCPDYDAKLVIGDMNKDSLKDIWANNQWMRDKHAEGKWDDIPVCKNCNYNTKL